MNMNHIAKEVLGISPGTGLMDSKDGVGTESKDEKSQLSTSILSLKGDAQPLNGYHPFRAEAEKTKERHYPVVGNKFPISSVPLLLEEYKTAEENLAQYDEVTSTGRRFWHLVRQFCREKAGDCAYETDWLGQTNDKSAQLHVPARNKEELIPYDILIRFGDQRIATMKTFIEKAKQVVSDGFDILKHFAVDVGFLEDMDEPIDSQACVQCEAHAGNGTFEFDDRMEELRSYLKHSQLISSETFREQKGLLYDTTTLKLRGWSTSYPIPNKLGSKAQRDQLLCLHLLKKMEPKTIMRFSEEFESCPPVLPPQKLWEKLAPEGPKFRDWILRMTGWNNRHQMRSLEEESPNSEVCSKPQFTEELDEESRSKSDEEYHNCHGSKASQPYTIPIR